MKLKDINKPALQRLFWSKVDSNSLDPDKCWEWRGLRYRTGHGHFKDKVVDPNTKKLIALSAHRFSYLLHYNEIPDGLYVCHRCDNPPCVNPDHLYLGTPRKNTQDAYDRNLITSAKGENHGRAKLSLKDVTRIYEMYYRQQMTIKDIASKMSVGPSTVSDILKGRRWSHVHEELTSSYKR